MSAKLDLPWLGVVLTDHRATSKLTLQQLSDSTGLSVGYLSDLEHDRTEPSLNTLYRLAAAYGIPAPVLLAEADGQAVHRLQTEATRLAAIAWPDDVPGPELADSLIARLCEETGELARAVRRYGRQRFGHDGEAKGTTADVRDEIGDVLFLLARIADLTGVDLGDAGVVVVEKIRRRIEAKRQGVPAS